MVCMPVTARLVTFPLSLHDALPISRRGLRRRLLDPLEDRGDALAAADAHGHERVALLRALELVERLHRQDRAGRAAVGVDRKSTRLNSSHVAISYVVFCLKKIKYNY